MDVAVQSDHRQFDEVSSGALEGSEDEGAPREEEGVRDDRESAVGDKERQGEEVLRRLNRWEATGRRKGGWRRSDGEEEAVLPEKLLLAPHTLRLTVPK